MSVTFEDDPDELSLYATDACWEDHGTEFHRYTLRQDGFVSVNSPYAGGDFTTRPIVFEGGRLTVNAETSAIGKICTKIQDEAGNPIKGYSLAECYPISCDSLNWYSKKLRGKIHTICCFLHVFAIPVQSFKML